LNLAVEGSQLAALFPMATMTVIFRLNRYHWFEHKQIKGMLHERVQGVDCWRGRNRADA